MNRKELAEALGISAPMVTKLAARGMPTDDLVKAQRWRKRHLEPTRMKGVRSDTLASEPAARRAPAPLPPAHTATALHDFDWEAPDLELRLAQHFATAAESAFLENEAVLRVFMCLVPRNDRLRLLFSANVYSRLMPAGFLQAVAPGYDPRVGRATQPVPISDRPSEDSLHVVYEVACGLRRFPSSKFSEVDAGPEEAADE